MYLAFVRLRRASGVAAATALMAVFAQGTAAWSQAAPSPPPPPASFRQLTPAIAAELDEAVNRTLHETKVPGVIVGLWARGKGSYVKAFGVADKTTRAPMKNTDLRFRIGSETKTFTVTALLQLVDQGKIGLDDPIGKYIADVPNGNKITLRELAGMRSGLFSYSEDPKFDKAFLANPNRVFTPEELLAYSFQHPVQFAPNSRFEYSNTNLILLGLVIEKITKRALHDVITDDVLKPAGLRSTVFPTSAEYSHPHPQGYTNQTASGKVANATDWDPSWAWAAGAMISDLQNLRSWAKTLATGTLLKPATQAERLKTQPIGDVPGAGYGLGIFNVQGWIGHNGSLPGYETLTVYLPQADATMVIELNADITVAGQEPSTVFGKAITSIVSPHHVYPGHKLSSHSD